MGGEYKFKFSGNKSRPFDLEKYQELILKLRDKYIKHPECVFYRTKEEIPVGDNILAKFKYECSRHASSWGAKHGTWCIQWDPTLDPDYKGDDISGRCSSDTFKQVHNQLLAAFPGMFHVYDDDLEEARGGYCSSRYSGYYRSRSESPDYTACGIECGYCGKCDY